MTKNAPSPFYCGQKSHVHNLQNRFNLLGSTPYKALVAFTDVVNPVAKKWHCGADIPVCFFLVKQEDRV